MEKGKGRGGWGKGREWRKMREKHVQFGITLLHFYWEGRKEGKNIKMTFHWKDSLKKKKQMKMIERKKKD